MKEIDTGDANLYMLDEHVVLVETREGVVLDIGKIRKFYAVIEQHLAGDYSLVINRRHKYALMRYEVYSEANQRDRLRAIAIVVHKKPAEQMASLEKPLSKKPFAMFKNVDDAIAWVRTMHQA